MQNVNTSLEERREDLKLKVQNLDITILASMLIGIGKVPCLGFSPKPNGKHAEPPTS